jgi:hypothetical protein
MPKMTLTDEEKRHIEQRRDNEKRFALGYNQAIDDLGNFLAETEAELGEGAIMESISVKTINEWTGYSRKVIR